MRVGCDPSGTSRWNDLDLLARSITQRGTNDAKQSVDCRKLKRDRVGQKREKSGRKGVKDVKGDKLHFGT